MLTHNGIFYWIAALSLLGALAAASASSTRCAARLVRDFRPLLGLRGFDTGMTAMRVDIDAFSLRRLSDAQSYDVR